MKVGTSRVRHRVARFAFWSAACLAVAGLGTSALAQPATGPATQPATRPATRPAKATAEVLSVIVSRPISPEVARATSIGRRSAVRPAAEEAAGTVEVAALVRLPDRFVLRSSPGSPQAVSTFRYATFVDDQHNDLRPPERERRSGFPSNHLATVVEGDRGLVLTLSAGRAPAPGAARVLLRGTLTVRTHAGERTGDRKPLTLKPGQAFDAGPFPLTVQGVSASPTGKGTRLTLAADRPLDRIVSLRFFANGKELDARPAGRGDSPAPNQSTLSFNLSESPAAVEVEATYLDPIEVMTIPVEVTADLGAVTLGEASAVPTTAPSRTAAGPVDDAAAAIDAGGGTAVATAPATKPAVAVEAGAFPATRPAFPPPPAPAAAAAGEAIAAEVMGVSVSRRPAADEAGEPRNKWPLRSDLLFQPHGGTNVRMMLTAPAGRGLLGVVPKSVRVTRFADDTGKELSTDQALPDQQRQQFNPFALSPVSADGRNALVDVSLAAVPSPAAKRLTVAGLVDVRVGVGERAAEQKAWPVAVGSTFKDGPLTLTVRSIQGGYPSYAAYEPVYQLQVGLVSNLPPDQIRSVEAFEADGTPIRVFVQRPPRNQPGAPNPEAVGAKPAEGAPAEYPFIVSLNRDADKVTLKVSCYDRAETVTVPLTISTGVGL